MAATRFSLKRLWQQVQALLDESALHSQQELSRLHKFLHFWVLVGRSFSRNRCPVRAAGLAYSTLLALIPMLAVVVGVMTIFLKSQGEEQIDQFIGKFVDTVMPRTLETTNSTGQTTANDPSPTGQTNAASGFRRLLPSLSREDSVVQARKEAVSSIHDFIQRTRSTAIGVTGVIALILTAISMLGQIENMLNDIWGVARSRNRFTQVVLYWGVISLAPLVIALAAGLASGPHMAWAHKLLALSPLIGKVLFRFIPVALVCLGFAAFYALMPNTKVHWSAALVGGAVGGLLWHLNGLVSVLFVSRVISNFNIYGSLGLVPVFMIGLYFSWMIVLFGAQVSYAFQNRKSYLEEKHVENIDQRSRELIALRLVARIGLRFVRGEPPLSTAEMGTEMGVPTRLIEQLMHTLCAARLVCEAGGKGSAYVPARPLEKMTCYDVLSAMRTARGEQLATCNEPSRGEVYREFLRIEQAEAKAAGSVTIRELVKRLEGTEQGGATQEKREPKRGPKEDGGNARSLAE